VTIIMVTHDQRLATQTRKMVLMFDGVITKEVMN
jgi:predicted ABC-type transport system involved in lysophospholipase L1 biosynthesis ATPase subunit